MYIYYAINFGFFLCLNKNKLITNVILARNYNYIYIYKGLYIGFMIFEITLYVLKYAEIIKAA